MNDNDAEIIREHTKQINALYGSNRRIIRTMCRRSWETTLLWIAVIITFSLHFL
jgi:hypothetical protein